MLILSEFIWLDQKIGMDVSHNGQIAFFQEIMMESAPMYINGRVSPMSRMLCKGRPARKLAWIHYYHWRWDV